MVAQFEPAPDFNYSDGDSTEQQSTRTGTSARLARGATPVALPTEVDRHAIPMATALGHGLTEIVAATASNG